MRASDEHAVADLRADLMGQIAAQHQRRHRRIVLASPGTPWDSWFAVPGFRSCTEPEVMVLSDGAYAAFIGRDDALDQCEAGARAARNQHLSVDAGRSGDDVRQIAQASKSGRQSRMPSD